MSRVLPFLFLVFIAFPFINDYLKIVDNSKSNENRTKADMPNFNVSVLDPFPQNYEAYFDDHFGLRNKYLELNNYYNYLVLKKSSAEKKVVIGKDGWLYRNTSFLPRCYETSVYEDQQLKEIDCEIQRRIDFYKDKGIEYYLFIVPVKPTIYPEYVSSEYSNENTEKNQNKTSQLMDYLSDKPTITRVDYLKDLLIERKQDYRIYHKMDHHWNEVGAMFASSFILEKLKKSFSEITNQNNLDNYSLTWESQHHGNLASVIGIEGIIKEDMPIMEAKPGAIELKNGKKKNYKAPKSFPYKWEYVKEKTTGNEKAPNILVIRDSFSNALIPFLSTGFNNSLYIWDSWMYQLNEDIVDIESPDIVINIVVETNVYNLVKYQKK